MKKIFKYIAYGLLILLILVQFVPYGRDHTNPPITGEPYWNEQRTRDLAQRACYDCHSNETKWPWYSNVAPMSWLVQNHVHEGRHELNFSEFDRPQKHFFIAADLVEEGEMPISNYVWMHSEANLSRAEKNELVQGLKATFVRPK